MTANLRLRTALVSVEVTYTGTVETRASMKGKISLAGLGEGTFTGKRR